MENNANIGDVVICAFPFEDNPKKRKLRPAVILDINARGLVVLSLKVTSKPPRSKYDYELVGWDLTGLHKKSTVRSNKEEIILRSDVAKPIGSLTVDDFEMVKTLYYESHKI